MKMLSVTEAQADLTAVLKCARKGEDIGIISDNQVIQFKPVQVIPYEDSYLFQEYGVTLAEWERFKKRQNRKCKVAQRQGKSKYFSGDLERDILD